METKAINTEVWNDLILETSFLSKEKKVVLPKITEAIEDIRLLLTEIEEEDGVVFDSNHGTVFYLDNLMSQSRKNQPFYFIDKSAVEMLLELLEYRRDRIMNILKDV